MCFSTTVGTALIIETGMELPRPQFDEQTKSEEAKKLIKPKAEGQ